MPMEFDAAAIRAELDQLEKGRNSNAIELTEDQEEALVYAIDSGVKWDALVDWWRSKGWRGSRDSLRRLYRQAKEKRK